MTFDIALNDPPQFRTAVRALRRPMNRNVEAREPDSEDIALGRKLVLRGDDHAKFARLIHVGFTIRAPRYWWIEYSTYSVGAASVSESTMHRKMSEPFVGSDFEDYSVPGDYLENLNTERRMYTIGHSNIALLKGMIPESYLQTRDCCMSYQTLRRVYFARKDHRLPHWQAFAKWIESLPHADAWITASKV
ncbi:MAG TPA: hypothetical protein VLH56_18665 [Dissulfurispiraceae bacterium]|nr:hypothetical protein [Dissulfurispiraceae bacterium]